MRAFDIDVAIIGAGPYGLTAAVQLDRRGIDRQVFGEPMEFWRRMPTGMLLRSNWGASSFVQPAGDLTLDAYVRETGIKVVAPVPLNDFVAYGAWVQERAVPDVDRRNVAHVGHSEGHFTLTLDDGEKVTARRVVVAAGIGRFGWRPPEFASLPLELATHSVDEPDLARFEGRRVVVIGGGQSALEGATLMQEAGTNVEVIARSPSLVWLRGHGVKKRIGALGPIVYAPTDVGPLWYSRLVSQPSLFRRLPRAAQTRIARRSIRPAGSDFVRRRLSHDSLTLGRQVTSASSVDGRVELQLDDGSQRAADHVLIATGFRIDLAKYGFIGEDILARVTTANGYPVLRRGLESSFPRLHFLGAPASWSFGPIMRFVSGSWFSGSELAESVAAEGRSSSTSVPASRPARPE